MSASEVNWGGDDTPISGPSQAAEAAVIGEEGALIFGIEQLEQARAGADTVTVGTPSSEASTVKLNQRGGATRKPRTFTERDDTVDPTPEPQYHNGGFSYDPLRNVNPGVNAQERYRGDRPKGMAESNVTPRFELFLLGDGEKKVTEAPDTRKSSTSHLAVSSCYN